MPKPNFVKKPMKKILDESLEKLPNRRERLCEDCDQPVSLCTCIPDDEDGDELVDTYDKFKYD